MTIYTDGSCINNPGPGCYGAIQIINNNYKILFTRTIKHTTNSKMELLAVLMCMIKFPSTKKTIYTDSKYIVNGFNNWMHNWNDKKWSKQIKHRSLWKLIYFFKNNTVIDWVKGHSDNTYNNIIDRIVYETNKDTWN